MTEVSIIIQLVVNILFTLSAVNIFFETFLSPKLYKVELAILMFILAIWQILIIINRLPFAIILIINVFIVSLISIMYTGSIATKIGFSILFVSIWTLVEFLVGYIFLILDFDIVIMAFYGSVTSKVVATGLIYLFKILKERSGISSYTEKHSWLILVTPLFSLTIMYVVFSYNMQSQIKYDFGLSLLLVGILLFSNIVVFKVYQLLIRDFEMTAKHNRYIQQFELTKEHLKEMNMMINKIRFLKHDANNHFIVLREHLNNNSTTKAIEYIDTILTESPSEHCISNTDNIAIDSVINTKYMKMQKHDIKFEFSINIPATIPFHGTDLSILLGNILDNAIEANEKKFDEKRIKLYIKYETNCLILSCINTVHNQIDINASGDFVTVKSDTDNHGYGITSIKNICDKYNGSVDFNYDLYVFVTKAVLFANVQE